MAFSVNTPVGDGVTKQFAVNFTNGIFSRDSVSVFVDGELDGSGNQIERDFIWINDGLIELTGDAPADGVTVNIRRIMDKQAPAVDFEDGEILTEANLDLTNDQLLNLIHELLDGYGYDSLQTDIDMNGNYITGLPKALVGDGAVTLDQALALINAQAEGLVARRRETRKIAAQDQTVFNLADVTYVPGINNIQVYVNGVAQVSTVDYFETNESTITFLSELSAGDAVDMYVNEITEGTYDPTAREDINALGSNAVGDGSDRVAHTGTTDTVTEALDKRTIYVGSVAELEALSSPSFGQQAIVSGTLFKYNGTAWKPSAGFVTAAAYGVVIGPAEDNSAALQNAIDAAESLPILLSEGETRYTETLNLQRETKFIGPRGNSGLFAGYTAYLNYAPGAAVKDSLASSTNDTQTTIDLVDASAFPSAGVVYIDNINGEWIRYTGKSGNTLTGCSRDTGPDGTQGGLVGAIAHNSGETVWLNRPALQRELNFTGSFVDVAIYHDGFVSQENGWDDLGVGLYIPKASYGHIIDNTLIYGFEKAAFFGEAFVTTIRSPAISRCRYGLQFNTGNGATVENSDFGQLGSASSSIGGWSLYFHLGHGACITGGNIGNGGNMVPAYADGHKELSISGTYQESSKLDPWIATNNGSLLVCNSYVKGANSLGRYSSGGIIDINGIHTDNINNLRVIVSGGETGRATVKNWVRIDDGNSAQADKFFRDSERYDIPSESLVYSAYLYPALVQSKTITDNTKTDLFKIQTLADSDITVGGKIRYTYGTPRNGGQAAEQGEVYFVLKHRINNAPVVAVSKVGDFAQALDAATLTTTWTARTVQVTGDRYETFIEFTANESNGSAGELDVFIDNSRPPLRQDDADFGKITLL